MSTSNDDPGQTSQTPPVPPPPPGPGYPDQGAYPNQQGGYPPPQGGYQQQGGYPPPPPGGYTQPGAQPPGGWQGYGPTKPRNGSGTAAMVIGIIAVLSAVILIGGLLGVVALVLGFIGLSKVRSGQATNRGMAISGIVLGIVAMLIAGFVVFLLVDNADEIDNFADCMEDAIDNDDEAAADRCADQFEEDLGN